MSLRRSEVPNFTREQIVGHVRDALEIAVECGLSDEERAALLPGIFERLSNKQVVIEQLPGLADLGRPGGFG